MEGINLEYHQLVFTVQNRCKVCYTCVRECPAKAIRIFNGQADILPDRCITCGNCVKVCSQGAKDYVKHSDEVDDLLHTNEKVAALVAPSFPSEFSDFKTHQNFVGVLKKLGFDYVFEVAFGADLVAHTFKKLVGSESNLQYITSDCPAIVKFVRKYYPELTDNLLPVCSPMNAMNRVVKTMFNNDIKTVFIGPCIAKKDDWDEVDYKITYRELRSLLQKSNINKDVIEPANFDPPYGGLGAIFPVSRGLIQTVDIDDKLYKSNIIAAEGREDFQEALKEFYSKTWGEEHLELLCCDGCIMGPGTTSLSNRFAKEAFVSNYVKRKLKNIDWQQWQNDLDYWLDTIDLSVKYIPTPIIDLIPSEDEIRSVLIELGKTTSEDELNCGACGYNTCREHAIAIIKGLAETEMCLPYTIDRLHSLLEELNISNKELQDAQEALKKTEKLATMGQLSAGIAHELNNPLGVIIMYANILYDECPPEDPKRKDLEMIVSQAERCRQIVRGLLNFARKNQVQYEKIAIEELFNKATHSVVVPENIEVKINVNPPTLEANIDVEQMLQVITNLIQNSIDAINSNKGEIILEAQTKDNYLVMTVYDNGIGIPNNNLTKIFEPFFTTKPVGKGTGLGLATVYGIIKMHKGKIEVESNADPTKGPTYTKFFIFIPQGKGK
ncbi:MAG TPA: [Fe-Fe] hydrogenase large subunit C-terminal domain-containing protein [Bacteroidales bacterium]|jgi:signal transduction histidine kinase/Fe-S-cluster-containing hydrogenase component 2|nr:4Fe-4S dicluster domain-containing protein [Bacteroidales bacterium]HNY75297.1 [Fe-Fe] hydrogenase large subunit C-terminal domain-containing protein [Bacteroidales bacterium]HOC39957.1 [Fe-Fe] hydrogenase large subunit C-terminal domain-containing protein [Bacteroidales bacterium]HOH93258.1 [Fe-Fe] hydrogenase large subunit C-terminal domain-containing protein [Bacteroidales bacterium]HOU81632.1 [Fe-Fe] hydrogenase large subunit C-terminal domain-containing protein [Bacteroidales bacterium]